MRLIDADALILELQKSGEENPSRKPIADGFISILRENCPTIESPPDWTPCAEGLPEEGQEVLFETALQVPATDYFGTYKGFYSDGIFWIDNVMHEKKFGISKQSVLAWQPLPAPYRADDTTGKVKEGVDNGN